MTKAGGPSKVISTIGQALLSDGVITEEQLARALRVQAHLEQHRQLGEILIELGFATKQAIAQCISRHGKGMRLGEILVEQGLIAQGDLDSALRLQVEQKLPLGTILVNLGLVSERTLMQNLASQSQVPYIEPNFALVDPDLLSGVSPDFLLQHLFLPFSRGDDGIVTIIVPNLQNDDMLLSAREAFHGELRLALGPEALIRQCIEDFRKFRADLAQGRGRGAAVSEDAVVQMVNHIIEQAIHDRASDIHIEPMVDRIRLRYRIDGVLVYKTDLPKDLQAKLVSRIKIVAECNITETRRHQGGRLLYSIGGVDYDMRVSIYVTVYGECVVIRVLNKQTGLIAIDELGLSPTTLLRYRDDVLEMPTGVVLITGPTGSGKTTTLYSSLAHNNRIDRKIITVEDPVEYTIEGLIQCSVHEKAGRSFENSLREIVRQDPDIIVLGEIRDRTTASIAIEAALTGHKVYSTFHTEDTIGGLVRLMNMEIESFLISSTVISVMAQRLLRRICPDCAVPYTPTPKEVRRLDLDVAEVQEYTFKRGIGCARCSHTGYIGRAAAYELLVLNDSVKEAIQKQRPAHVIRRISMETTGLISMREDAIAKAIRGATSFEEVLRHTPKTFEMRPLKQILSMTQ